MSLSICHDGMFPEMAREAALKVPKYCSGLQDNKSYKTELGTDKPVKCCANLMYTVSVALAGCDGTFRKHGGGNVCGSEGDILERVMVYLTILLRVN